MNKKELVDSWVSERSKEWLANQLANARSEMYKAKKELNSVKYKVDAARNNENAMREQRDLVLRRNSNMAEYLKKFGANIREYRVTYIKQDCKSCEYMYHKENIWDYACGNEEDYNFKCPTQEAVETFHLYDIIIEDGGIGGYTSDFDAKGVDDVIKVVDLSTNETVYERKDCKDYEVDEWD